MTFQCVLNVYFISRVPAWHAFGEQHLGVEWYCVARILSKHAQRAQSQWVYPWGSITCLSVYLSINQSVIQKYDLPLIIKRANSKIKASNYSFFTGFLYFSSINQEVTLLDREIDSYKKSISKEQERNEILTMELAGFQIECAATKKQICKKQAEEETLQRQYITCVHSVKETENNLLRLNKVAIRQPLYTSICQAKHCSSIDFLPSPFLSTTNSTLHYFPWWL